MDLVTYKARLDTLPPYQDSSISEYQTALDTLAEEVLNSFNLGPLDTNWTIVMADWRAVTDLVKDMHQAEKEGFEYLMPVEQADLPSGQGDDLLAICSKVPLEPGPATILADLYYNRGAFE